MSRWQDFKDKAENWLNDKAENWAKHWKDPEAADKSIAASAIGIIAPAGYPEHSGWRKEVRQNIENRKIDHQAQSFQDQLTNSLKDIRMPEREIGKERERER